MKSLLVAAAVMATVAALTAEASAQPAPPPSPSPIPPQASYPVPPPGMWFPGVYLRVDGGYGFSADTSFRDVNDGLTLGDGVRINGDSGSSPLYDVGVGGRFNRFFRADVTASYLPSLKFSGTDNLGVGTVNNAQIHSGVLLVNGYFDLPPLLTIFGPFVQPYFDLGLGAARNHVGSMFSTAIGGTFGPHTQTEPAIAVGLGLAISLGANSMLDIGYRFIDLGEIRTGSSAEINGVSTGISPIKAQLGVHTLTAGLRFGF